VIESPVDDDRLKGGRAMRDDLARKLPKIRWMAQEREGPKARDRVA
jgi:hypothetical protein